MSLFTRKLKTLNTIHVSKSAILGNLDHFQKEFPKHWIFPVLKSNAYGHGIKTVVHALEERSFPYLAVDSYYEALRIREYSARPLLLIGYTLLENIPLMDLENTAVTLYDMGTLKILEQLKKPVRIHLKINTGMNRQGIAPEELPVFLEKILACPHIALEGILSHFCESDMVESNFTTSQEGLFSHCLDVVETYMPLPPYIHLSATHGVFSTKDPRINAIRLGIGLYGHHTIAPEDPRYTWYEQLTPALEVTSTIIHKVHVKKGEHVSYAGKFIAPKDMTIAVVPFGYYEGYTRSLSNKATVEWKGHHLPLVGNVCMNLSCVDGTSLPLEVGECVTIVSAKKHSPCSMEALSKKAGTINYELLVKLSESIRRQLVD